MYPFAVHKPGLTDGADARSMALRLGLPLDRSVPSHLSAAAVAAAVSQQHGMDASLSNSAALASEIMSSSSQQLQDRERIITAELKLLKARRQQHDQVATAMALVSRNSAFSKHHQQQQLSQQHPSSQEDILNRAVSHISAISRHGSLMNHRAKATLPSLTGEKQHIPAANNALYCAEPDLSLEKDICFGRGQRVQRRKANVAFRKIVATYQETYDQAVSREDKKAVVKKVSRIFSRTGYRFFKECEDASVYGNGKKIWVAVSDHHVEYKIGHSFRSGRKQLKQQKILRKEKEASSNINSNSNSSSSSSSSDASVSNNSSSEVVSPKKTKKEPEPVVVPREEQHNDQHHCVYKEDELSDKCICIGDKRDKYTGMEAYQYFREFILTFKSIFGMTESYVEKTKIVSGLIEQIKSKKGYKFLKLTPTNEGIEVWIEASSEEISCEVFAILGNPLASSIEETKEQRQKRTSDTAGNTSEQEGPNKRLCLTPQSTTDRPATIVRTVSESQGMTTQSKIAKTSKLDSSAATKGDLISSSSASSATKLENKRDFVWKKGRKRSLPEGVKRHNFVPSEIICKTKVEKVHSLTATDGTVNKLKNKADPFSKAQRDVMSSISTQGMRIPPSLISPGSFSGKSLSFSNCASGTLARSLETLRQSQSLLDTTSSIERVSLGNRLSSADWPGGSTLDKALLAMRPSMHRAREATPSMVENANLEAAQHIEMKGQLLQHLRQQEMLYMEKKHKLAMLDLQLRSRSGGI